MLLVPECYANKCIAEELKNMLVGKISSNIWISHSHKQGRDRIINYLLRRGSRINNIIIGVIDYERGISRKYVETIFELTSINENILIGTSKYADNVVVVVFDPDIEEGFLCRIEEKLCRNIEYYERIKSREACMFLSRYLKKKQFRSLLKIIASRLLEIIDKNK